jgi:hypothetical protein
MGRRDHEITVVVLRADIDDQVTGGRDPGVGI